MVPAEKADAYQPVRGQKALMRVKPTVPKGEPIWVLVKITASKMMFGREYLCVAPVKGEGTLWVEPGRLRFQD